MNRLASNEKKIKSLITKHKQFEIKLLEAKKSLSVDDLLITDLKKQKLKIRDQLQKLAK